MLRTTLALILSLTQIHGLFVRCPSGSGLTEEEPCIISYQQLQADESIIVDIPSSVGYVLINCGNKGCEKKVTAFLGANKTRVVCPTPDSCLGSTFYCARGPPDTDQNDYRGYGNIGPECILEANSGVSSVAKEAEFIVFSPGKGTVKAIGNVAFGTAKYRCYSDDCILECSDGACTDTDINDGNKMVTCVGDGCNGFKDSEAALFPPIIAEPDTDGNCVINTGDLGITDSKTNIIFKNNCVNAVLNCDSKPDACAKRKIYCAAQHMCDIKCGGQDPAKLNENPIPNVAGACKESEFILGPVLFGLPSGTNEHEFDRPLFGGHIQLLVANIELIGDDSNGKGKINAILTDVNINANGPKTFGEGVITCGFSGSKPSNKQVDIGSCILNCSNGDIPGELACDKCSFNQFGTIFNSIGQVCRNRQLSPNRLYINGNTNHNSDVQNTSIYSSDIIVPIKRVWKWAIFIVIVCIFIIVSRLLFKRYFKINKNNGENNKLIQEMTNQVYISHGFTNLNSVQHI